MMADERTFLPKTAMTPQEYFEAVKERKHSITDAQLMSIYEKKES